MSDSIHGPSPEPLRTIGETAELLGLKAWQLRRAIKRGDVPSYSIGNGRKRVFLSEVLAVIHASRKGGA